MNRRALAVLAATGLLLAGCGVPTEGTPRALDTPATTATPQPAPTSTGAATETLFFLDDGRLVAVSRHVQGLPDAGRLVRDLLAGPTEPEQRAGLSSALLGDGLVTGVRVAGDIATVQLGPALAASGRNDEVLAYAQLTCTLTSLETVTGVLFTQDGNAIAVPRADGSLVAYPLTAADYADLLASPAPSTSPVPSGPLPTASPSR